MADLGSDDLLREICDAAEFVAVETEYSRGLMAQRCPESAAKIHSRVQRNESRQFSPPVYVAFSGKAGANSERRAIGCI